MENYNIGAGTENRTRVSTLGRSHSATKPYPLERFAFYARIVSFSNKKERFDMKKVVIYSTPNCTYCNMAKEFFAANNVSFESVDVAADPARRQEMIDKSGQMGVPVILIDDQMIVGFNKRMLSNLLGIAAA